MMMMTTVIVSYYDYYDNDCMYTSSNNDIPSKTIANTYDYMNNTIIIIKYDSTNKLIPTSD